MVPEEEALAFWQEEVVWVLKIDYGRLVAEYHFGRRPKDCPTSMFVRAMGKRLPTHQTVQTPRQWVRSVI